MNKSWLIIGSIATTLLLWASAFVGIRAGLEAYSPTQLSFLRYATASLILLLFIGREKIRLPDRKDIPRIMIIGLIGITIYNVALNFGEVSVTAGVASFIVNTVPIFTSILAVLILKEKMTYWGWGAIILSFLGVSIISLDDIRNMHISSGTLLLLIAAISQAIFFVLQKPLLIKYRPIEVTTYAILAGTLFMLPFSHDIVDGIKHAPTAKTMVVIYLGIFPGALAYLSWSFALSKVQASTVSSFLFLVPLLTLGIAWIWLSEIPTMYTWIGGILILAGVVCMNTLGKAKSIPAEGHINLTK
ncbi:DMT family transporter [Bacillus horti]|uniref:Drug/metabolite transporter (DMT)-like permease n=1 Tax=Caldalkalibacillus horti TaxID=77523 RepID=A0ABT9VY23_9BACI|nr:EamA family transporter [Bacillus horti]MDQ0165891.1 drug/metabolite transporter (DMT)-like permease [Bacillus horti]